MKRVSNVSSSVYQRIWKSKAFVACLVVVLVFILISVTKETLRGIETRYEIEKLEKEYARLEQRNTQLNALISTLNTSAFQEKEARVKLGVQSAGEKVVIFPDQRKNNQIVLPNQDTQEYIPINDFQSNPEKWYHYFWDKLNQKTL